MATKAELQKKIDELDAAIARVATTGATISIDILGYRRIINNANIKDLITAKQHYQQELKRANNNDNGRRGFRVY